MARRQTWRDVDVVARDIAKVARELEMLDKRMRQPVYRRRSPSPTQMVERAWSDAGRHLGDAMEKHHDDEHRRQRV